MKSRYAVKSATLKFNGITYEMASGPVMRSETRDAVEVTSLEDSYKQFIPGALAEENEFTVTLFSKGSESDLTINRGSGPLEITVTLSNGENDVDASYSYTAAIVTAVTASEIDASGDRKATYQVTFRPTGE